METDWTFELWLYALQINEIFMILMTFVGTVDNDFPGSSSEPH